MSLKLLLHKFSVALPLVFYSSVLFSNGLPKKVDWALLRKLNIDSRTMPPELSSLNGREVELLGFIIPFEDGKDSAAEFLLVPSPQVCVHVPPPPPNQIVWVRMKKGTIPVKLAPFYVTGILHIMTNDSPVGKVSYFLDGLTVTENPK